jgi:hypothetical protein
VALAAGCLRTPGFHKTAGGINYFTPTDIFRLFFFTQYLVSVEHYHLIFRREPHYVIQLIGVLSVTYRRGFIKTKMFLLAVVCNVTCFPL